MYCIKCGSKMDDNAISCPACGARQNEPKTAISDSNANPQPNDARAADGKLPFYLQMWFIGGWAFLICGLGTILTAVSLDFLDSGYVDLFSFLSMLTIVLFILRIVKYPEHRKGAWIGCAAILGISLAFSMLIFTIMPPK